VRFQQVLDDFRMRCHARTGIDLSDGEHYAAVARFLGITTRSLRRYRTGHKPIPRQLAIIAVIMRRNPAITMSQIETWLAEEQATARKCTADNLSAR
jgi:hypothetical protein